MLRRCCFNWKVWLGVGTAAIAVIAVAPRAAGAIVPIALGLACPLSMVAMMLGMRSSVGGRPAGSDHDEARARIEALESELAQLRGGPPNDRAVREPDVAVGRPHGPDSPAR